MNQNKLKLFTVCAVLMVTAFVFVGCGNNNGTNNPDEATVGDMENDTTDNTLEEDTGNAASDGGNAVDDVIDGAGNAVDDAVDGVENAVDDITGNEDKEENATLNDAITSTANQTDLSGGATKTN